MSSARGTRGSRTSAGGYRSRHGHTRHVRVRRASRTWSTFLSVANCTVAFPETWANATDPPDRSALETSKCTCDMTSGRRTTRADDPHRLLAARCEQYHVDHRD